MADATLTMPDDALRKCFENAFRQAVDVARESYVTLITAGVTHHQLALAFAANNPLPGFQPFDRMCEMAEAGEFDEFLKHLLPTDTN